MRGLLRKRMKATSGINEVIGTPPDAHAPLLLIRRHRRPRRRHGVFKPKRDVGPGCFRPLNTFACGDLPAIGVQQRDVHAVVAGRGEADGGRRLPCVAENRVTPLGRGVDRPSHRDARFGGLAFEHESGADLMPARWVGQVKIDEDAIASSFFTSFEAMQRTIQQINNTSMNFDPLLGKLPKPRITTIQELIDNGVLEIRIGRSDKSRNLDETSEGRVARAVDIRDRRLPSVDGLEEFTHRDLTEEGDVLVTTINF